MTIWSTWINPPHAYGIVLPFCIPLLLIGLFYDVIPAHLVGLVRLVLSILHVFFICALIVFGPLIGLIPNPQAINIILLVGPLTALAWTFVFFDRPRTGLVLTTLLALAASALIAQWSQLLQEAGNGIWFILLLTCQLGAWFGRRVNQLQYRALLIELDLQLDILTGLQNRRAFEHFRLPAQSVGYLAVLDVDHFKAVNDVYGHPAGDRILRALGDVLLDQTPPGATAFRWGGEEFALLLPGHDLDASLKLVQAVCTEITARTFTGGQHVSLSCGLSPFGPAPTLPLSVAFRQADAALLNAKRLGRNRIALWADSPASE